MNSLFKKFNTKIPKIAVVFNLKKEPGPNMPEDFYAEFDNLSVPTAIKEAIERKGFQAEMIEANEAFYEKIRFGNYDFVFNIAEGLNGGSRESQVPAILDMLNIPYTGSGVFTQALTLDKRRTKEILQFYGIPTPKFQLFTSYNQKLNPELRFPLFVKPNGEGSSKGIRNDSLVFDEDGLRKMIKFVLSNYNQSALVEEYLEGREFTVALLGNNPPRVMPIVEVTFDYLPEHIPKFDSYEVKWVWDSPSNPVDPVICPANIPKELEKMIRATALNAFKVLGCVDLARIDMRLDKNGTPNVLEINALPGLMPDPLENSRFPKACFTAGMRYDEIINTILIEAMKRYGLLKEIDAEIKNENKLQQRKKRN
jgi:D-alanine-D-alanine ligase